MTGGLKDAPSMLAGAVPTVGELFRSAAQVHSSSIAIEYQGRQISYGQLLQRVERASAMLAGHGLRRGDRVALLSHNRPEYFEIELAAAILRAELGTVPRALALAAINRTAALGALAPPAPSG